MVETYIIEKIFEDIDKSLLDTDKAKDWKDKSGIYSQSLFLYRRK